MREISALLLLFFSACSSGQTPIQTAKQISSVPGEDACSRPIGEPDFISIATLLANPERYEGRPVGVIGFYHSGFEHSAIYLHRDDATQFIPTNGFWLRGRIPDELRERYVSVSGIFTTKSRGHLGQWPGTICGALQVQPWGKAEP
ncbi:MAG: hypothetical protein EON58_08680 [Alphaproteobacteria bacterium]|nr:MAG: hypothetical protein EON58_08680 [Alphaproteobacteria bacterium]